ncbi:MAG: CRISPR-associated endonuclease Cas3'', partial [Mariprofundaceae bacterium]
MNEAKYAAHIDENGRIHALEEHLAHVADRAGAFATGFGREWAALAGRWHDLGKYSATFQKMIFEANGMEAHVEVEGTPGPRNHSTAGAIHAVERFGAAGRILAYLIAGHHAGLPDWDKDEAPGASLRERLAERSLLEDALKAEIPEAILEGDLPDFPEAGLGEEQGFALWVRMLFSALVDADFLDTEAFYDSGKARARSGWLPLEALKAKFDSHMRDLAGKAEDTLVNRLRARVLA